MSLLESALSYAAMGWAVFPCQPRKKIPFEKTRGVKDATTDAAVITDWWQRWPDANIALACGEVSGGVYVVDLDVKSGVDGVCSIADAGVLLPDTVQARTPTGGAHYFFKKNGQAPKNKNSLLPGVDIRCDGYYVMLAPSIHPCGEPYRWEIPPESGEMLDYPPKLLAMTPKATLPWATKKPAAVATVPRRPSSTPIIDRASAYLRECEPAVQGQAGHDSLLWAARAMVVGFEISDADALALLWHEYNPRCQPPWNAADAAEAKDFDRKVREARTSPSQKPAGWLLDEYGLRTGDEALAALGAKLTNGLLSGKTEPKPRSAPEPTPSSDAFPIDAFPDRIRDYILCVAESQVVPPEGVALAVLVAAGAAIGNSRRLSIKKGFEVGPTLWGMIVAPSGSNKSGPFREIIKPLRPAVPINKIASPMLNPQGQILVEDATIEAVVDILGHAPRGLCLVNGEGSGWVSGFDRYSKGGGNKKPGIDESIWIKFWDADPYQLNRKTDKENVLIHAAAVSVIACIQPSKMAECFDPSQFASGLVPRLLVVSVPRIKRKWSDREMDDAQTEFWSETITALRAIPFESMDPNSGQYNPRKIKLDAAAKRRYIEEWTRLEEMIDTGDDATALFAAKSEGMTARIALVLHHLDAVCDRAPLNGPVEVGVMERAIGLGRYFLGQQLGIYGIAGQQFCRHRAAEIAMIARDLDKTRLKPRDLMRKNGSRWKKTYVAKAELDRMVAAGFGRWLNPNEMEIVGMDKLLKGAGLITANAQISGDTPSAESDCSTQRKDDR